MDQQREWVEEEYLMDVEVMTRDLHQYGDGTPFHWVVVAFTDGQIVSFAADVECTDDRCIAFARTRKIF